ncbi:MAG: SigE family RNA polymerase sigma factor [Nocardioidaceae bacterium]|nr:SigE family RNA polymerase sigma factor [Nocardioidaceae bacterium]
MRSEADFASYMSARWARLVRAGLLLGCSPPEAEDLVQSTLLRCYVSWDKVSASSDRDAYVYRALMNTHAQSRRRRWWRSEQPSDDEFPDVGDDLTDVADQVTSQQMLRVALGRLPVPYRQVVVLRYYADLTEQQVAHVLDIPVGTVKSRTSRGLAQLLASLETSSQQKESSDERR